MMTYKKKQEGELNSKCAASELNSKCVRPSTHKNATCTNMNLVTSSPTPKEELKL